MGVGVKWEKRGLILGWGHSLPRSRLVETSLLLFDIEFYSFAFCLNSYAVNSDT